MFERIRDILVDMFGFGEEEITLDTTLVENLMFDELDMVEFIMGIEEEFDIEIPDDECNEVFGFIDVCYTTGFSKDATVGEVVEYMTNKVGLVN